MTRRRFRETKRTDARSEYHDAGVERLVEKLRPWLLQQPEWLAVLAADRSTRKRYGQRIADEVTRIPPFVRVAVQEKPANLDQAGAVVKDEP